ncbi:MAG: 4-hydroxy-tetrahydrodipicolinate reductase [Candidatus Edwardsbacteria bacterium]|nr:4-hydroxy-tetrahydrodipicolinate reductase [Candidatus Edwardsbacteria bacterium]
MINIIICGAAGRMGRAIIDACRENPDFAIVGLVECLGYSMIGQKFGDTLPELSADLGKIIDQGDVVIDFTSPEASLKNARIAAQHKKPMVIGATGINPDQTKELQELSKKIPLLVSSNLSIGVNLFYDIISRAARIIPGNYDVEIIESHHKNKKDAPSGTAKKLLSEITAARGGQPVYQRESSGKPRAEGEIGVVSIRAGDIVGEHTVVFAGPGERLEFTHRAHSRRVFAEGALAAARFLARARPGMYDMKDVLEK